MTADANAVAARALREAAEALTHDVREEATHARAIRYLRRRAEAYETGEWTMTGSGSETETEGSSSPT